MKPLSLKQSACRTISRIFYQKFPTLISGTLPWLAAIQIVGSDLSDFIPETVAEDLLLAGFVWDYSAAYKFIVFLREVAIITRLELMDAIVKSGTLVKVENSPNMYQSTVYKGLSLEEIGNSSVLILSYEWNTIEEYKFHPFYILQHIPVEGLIIGYTDQFVLCPSFFTEYSFTEAFVFDVSEPCQQDKINLLEKPILRSRFFLERPIAATPIPNIDDLAHHVCKKMHNRKELSEYLQAAIGAI